MSERVPCVVFGCRRTFKRQPGDSDAIEYMCRDHYRLSDKALRALRTQLKRLARRRGWSPRFTRIDNWLWDRIKRQATERAMGL